MLRLTFKTTHFVFGMPAKTLYPLCSHCAHSREKMPCCAEANAAVPPDEGADPLLAPLFDKAGLSRQGSPVQGTLVSLAPELRRQKQFYRGLMIVSPHVIKAQFTRTCSTFFAIVRANTPRGVHFEGILVLPERLQSPWSARTPRSNLQLPGNAPPTPLLTDSTRMRYT